MADNLGPSPEARVHLQPRRARPFYGRHPWVYPGAISHLEGAPNDGEVVDLVAHGGQFVARGLFNSQSKLRVRLYTWDEDSLLDAEFFERRLESAIELRRTLGYLQNGGACRLVCSEGDGLSGCTVDQFGPWLVIQFSSLGLALRQQVFVEKLHDILAPRGIYLRTERGIGQLEGLSARDGLLSGEAPTEPIAIEEGNVKFLVDLAEGQKTGFYLDQRDNRQVVADLAKGRRVLDAFCYSGGFGIHAAKVGAESVLGIDQSEPALELARRNAEANGLNQLEFVRANVFDELERLVERNERFGLVILDPPKFARSRSAIDEAMRGYRRLHSLALKLVEEDGFLVSCCCSGVIAQELFEEMVSQVSSREKRDVQLLHRRGPAPDHPVAITCPESHYLKCLIARVR